DCLVHEAEMIAVAVVLGERLPVGGAAMLHPAGGELDLAVGREIAGAIDQPGRRPEVLVERDASRAKAREDEAAIARHARCPRQPVSALVEARVAPRVRDAQ